MKKLPIVLCAALVAATSPAWAEVTYTPVDPLSYDFGIGLYNPGDPANLNTVFVDPAYMSDTFVFTFAIHANTQIPVGVDRLHFSFVYDNSSIDVVAARPVGDWHGDNYADMEWPNTSHGVIAVASLSQFMTGTSHLILTNSVIVPFLQVTLHVKGEVSSQIDPFGITLPGFSPATYGMTLFLSGDPIVLPGQWTYFGGAIHVPEPATMILLGGGLTGLVGGFLRRRR